MGRIDELEEKIKTLEERIKTLETTIQTILYNKREWFKDVRDHIKKRGGMYYNELKAKYPLGNADTKKSFLYAYRNEIATLKLIGRGNPIFLYYFGDKTTILYKLKEIWDKEFLEHKAISFTVLKNHYKLNERQINTIKFFIKTHLLKYCYIDNRGVYVRRRK